VGGVKYPNLVLKKGYLSTESELYKLKQKHMKDLPSGSMKSPRWSTPDRFAGTIAIIGPNGREAKWFFSGAWIVKWEGPDLDASKNEISVESIEIAHNGLVLVGSDRASQPAGQQQPAPPASPSKITINFGTGSADAGASAALAQKGADLKNNPDKRVRVEGHTDNVGSAASNQALSQQRADAVRSQLITGGASPSQVTAIGYGEDRPIADNNTSSGRAQNRRVEVIDE
jgi:OOP family OmpA-OmpF porin